MRAKTGDIMNGTASDCYDDFHIFFQFCQHFGCGDFVRMEPIRVQNDFLLRKRMPVGSRPITVFSIERTAFSGYTEFLHIFLKIPQTPRFNHCCARYQIMCSAAGTLPAVLRKVMYHNIISL